MTLDELISLHPMLKDTQCGVYVEDGWISLVHLLCDKIGKHYKSLGTPTPVVSQVKQKFGALRVYIDDADEYVYGLIAMAEAISTSVCERCGNRGELRGGGWTRTLCEGCASDQRKR